MGTFRYAAEFRADAVALVRSSDRPLAQVARDLGVNHETLRQWVKAAERAEDPVAVSYRHPQVGRRTAGSWSIEHGSLEPRALELERTPRSA